MKRPYILNTVLIVAGLMIGIMGAEGVLRVLKPAQAAPAQAPCVFVKDSVWGYRYQPQAQGLMSKNFEFHNRVEINNLGFHDIDRETYAAPDQRYIFALGDSFTAALEVAKSTGWTQIAEQALHERVSENLAVINLGLDGSGTAVHLAILEEYLPRFNPELVILAFYKNDPQDITEKQIIRECYQGYTLAYYHEATGERLRATVDNARPLSGLSAWLYDHTYLFRMLIFGIGDNIFWRRGYRSPAKNWLSPSMLGWSEDKQRQNPRSLDDLFSAFLNLSKQYGFRFLVIPVPANDNWAVPKDSMIVLEEALSPEVWSQLDIVDILPHIETQLATETISYDRLFWQYDEHFTVTGNRFFGNAVADTIGQYFQNSPIFLHVDPPQAGLWSAVQWQDEQGDWHTVEGWQGPLDLGGNIRWWVAEEHYGTGPFRWAVLDSPGGSLLGASPSFMLPGRGESLRMVVDLSQ